MEKLQSTKAINNLKANAIKKGGYAKFRMQIIAACEKHFELFGVDLTPLHLL